MCPQRVELYTGHTIPPARLWPSDHDDDDDDDGDDDDDDDEDVDKTRSVADAHDSLCPPARSPSHRQSPTGHLSFPQEFPLIYIHIHCPSYPSSLLSIAPLIHCHRPPDYNLHPDVLKMLSSLFQSKSMPLSSSLPAKRLPPPHLKESEGAFVSEDSSDNLHGACASVSGFPGCLSEEAFHLPIEQSCHCCTIGSTSYTSSSAFLFVILRGTLKYCLADFDLQRGTPPQFADICFLRIWWILGYPQR